jgi:putative transposase
VKKRFSDEQIIGFLNQTDAGVSVKELCRQHGFSDVSFNVLHLALHVRRYDGAGCEATAGSGNGECAAQEAVGRIDTGCRSTESRIRPKALSPQVKREAVMAMLENTKISGRRACLLVGLSRTVLHYQSEARPENEQLQSRMVALAGERRRFGYRRLHALLRREGVEANHKWIFRLYQGAGLAVKRRRKRQAVTVEREQLALPSRPNEVWSMNFVSDALANGRRIKVLTIVDDFTKESVDLVAEHGISGRHVVRVLERAAQFRGMPSAIRTDQGPEFTGKALDQWAYQNGVHLKLIEPGKPTQNA